MTTKYTSTLHLEKPDFRSPDWAPAMQRNLDALDTAIRNVLMNTQPWANLTTFSIGKVALDTLLGTYWICNVTHITGASPLTFSQERIANPTYWAAFSFGIRSRGAWVNNTGYLVNDISYDSVRGITGICNTAHTSNVSGSILDDSVKWDFIVNLPTVFTARATNYDNSISHLVSTNVQDAIDEIKANVAGAYISSNTTYDHTISGLLSTNVKSAIDELKAMIDASNVLIAANTTAIVTGTIAAGFMQWRPTSEVLVGWTVCNGLTVGDALSSATSRANSDCLNQFTYLWNNFSNTECPVSTGRGANPAADFAAHKTITLLDMKGTLGGLGIDTMGGSATTRLNGVTIVTGGTTTVSSVLGSNTYILGITETPSHAHANSLSDPGHIHTYTKAISQGLFGVNGGAVQGVDFQSNSTVSSTTGMSITNANAGGGLAHQILSRSKAGYWYMKL